MALTPLPLPSHSLTPVQYVPKAENIPKPIAYIDFHAPDACYSLGCGHQLLMNIKNDSRPAEDSIVVIRKYLPHMPCHDLAAARSFPNLALDHETRKRPSLRKKLQKQQTRRLVPLAKKEKGRKVNNIKTRTYTLNITDPGVGCRENRALHEKGPGFNLWHF